jgi:hypothetical protein
MVSKPLFVLLNATLQTCLINGATRVRESGLTVSTEKLPGETILFFRTDSGEGRKNLCMLQDNLKVCDYLVYYAKAEHEKEIICFLELKGKNVEEAVRQVINTCQYVKALIKQHITESQHQHIVRKVCICLHGRTSRLKQSLNDQLIKEFGKNNIRIKHGLTHDKELGSFLR